MRSIVSIKITDKGKHWHKEVRIFGVLVYSRHDYTECERQAPIGFTVFPSTLVNVEEDYYETDKV